MKGFSSGIRDGRGDIFRVLLATLLFIGVFSAVLAYRGIEPARSATTSSTPRGDVWGTDGEVKAVLPVGDVIYIGGDFTCVGPITGSEVPSIETGGVARNGLAAIDITTGKATSWDPNVSYVEFPSWRTVETLAVSGSTIYVGGKFSSIGGQTRNNIAAIDAVTGNPTGWNPDVILKYSNEGAPELNNGIVISLTFFGTTLYAGGKFNLVGGQTRCNIAAIDAVTGNPTGWNPQVPNIVNALAISGTTLYIGGCFYNVGNQNRKGLASFDLTTGDLTAWNPCVSLKTETDTFGNGQVYALAVDGSTVYAGGCFTFIGWQTRKNLAAIDGAGNPTAWNPDVGGSVFALTLSGTTLYAGGLIISVGGQVRHSLAAMDTTTGSPTGWNPDVTGDIHVLVNSGAVIFAGGGFTPIGGQAGGGLAIFPGEYTVTASVKAGQGSLDPATGQVAHGDTASVKITPEPGWHIAGITDNGAAVPVTDPAGMTHTITNVTSDHDVEVVFALDGSVTIISISPSSGVNTGVVNVSNLSGDGFLNGATVTFKKAGSSDIAATDVVVVSGSKITCNVDLSGAQAGPWDVVVTNPGGQSATLAGAFNVNPLIACGSGASGTLFLLGGMMGLLSLGQHTRRRRRRK